MSTARWIGLATTHVAMLALGFALGIYVLPILSAPGSPSVAEVQAATGAARFTAQFRRDLKDSDALHWGEGRVTIGSQGIGFEGTLAPGPAYKLYLAREFVETERDFLRVKPTAVALGDVKTFKNFVVPIPPGIDPAEYSAVIVWCEAFSQFITAAKYR